MKSEDMMPKRSKLRLYVLMLVVILGFATMYDSLRGIDSPEELPACLDSEPMEPEACYVTWKWATVDTGIPLIIHVRYSEFTEEPKSDIEYLKEIFKKESFFAS